MHDVADRSRAAVDARLLASPVHARHLALHRRRTRRRRSWRSLNRAWPCTDAGCGHRRDLQFASYDELWHWSTTDLAGFWSSIWEFFGVESPTPWRCVIEAEVMPGAKWFPGAQVNYAQQVLRHADAAHAAGQPAIVFQNERMAAPVRDCRWPELRRQVGASPQRLRAAGVQPGDRVCAYLPNTPHTVVAFLAMRQRRRDLVGVLARHGPGGGARPLPPDRAQGADRLRRLASRAAWRTTAGRCCARCWRACRACSTWCGWPMSMPVPTAPTGPRRRAGVHAFADWAGRRS